MRKDVHAPRQAPLCNMCKGAGKVQVIGPVSGEKVWHPCLCQRKTLLTK